MDYLPLYADLNNRPCLIVGGGDIAFRKARMLLKAGAVVHVVSPELNDSFKALLSNGDINHVSDVFSQDQLDGMFLAIAATDKKTVNALVYECANQRQILVNVVDDTKKCSFILPSIIDRSPLIVAISSSGKSPVLARLIREKLEGVLPQHLGKMAQISGDFRERLKTKVASITARRRFWERTFNGRFSDLIASGKEDDAKAELESTMIEINNDEKAKGEVFLIGAGPGDPGLLTLRALQLMQEADVVLYDYLVSAEVLDLVRRDADLVCVGKKAGHHSVPQEETNQLLVNYAQQGKRVARLKGGDPFMFGRGGEELEVLFEAGVPFQVVPGITAAAGATAYAGIPLTHRDYAQSATFITGHLKADTEKMDWSVLARSKQTLVIYMGLMKASHIQTQLIANHRASDTPVAIIERGTQKVQKVLKGELSQLAELAEDAASPSLIVIGEVVKLSDKLNWFGQK